MGKKLIASRHQTKLVDAETADALVLTGSFVHVVGYGTPTVQRQKTARRWRRHVEARRKAGYRLVTFWAGPDLQRRLRAEKRQGESWPALFDRLLDAVGASGGNSRPHTDARADAEVDKEDAS